MGVNPSSSNLVEAHKLAAFLTGEEMQALLVDINNPYSQFYLDVARNKHDLGINTFNQYIRQAININEEEITGLKAYQIALDILQNRGLDLEINNLVRKLELD